MKSWDFLAGYWVGSGLVLTIFGLAAKDYLMAGGGAACLLIGSALKLILFYKGCKN